MKAKKHKKRLVKKRKRAAARFVKLEDRLRRITTDTERRMSSFARAQSRELAKETNKALNEYQKAHKGAQSKGLPVR